MGAHYRAGCGPGITLLLDFLLEEGRCWAKTEAGDEHCSGKAEPLPAAGTLVPELWWEIRA